MNLVELAQSLQVDSFRIGTAEMTGSYLPLLSTQWHPTNIYSILKANESAVALVSAAVLVIYCNIGSCTKRRLKLYTLSARCGPVHLSS